MSAQTQVGYIKGSITDGETGEGLPAATVYLIGTYYGATSEESGNYLVTDIKPGDYSVKVQYVGYVEQVYTGITVSAGQTTTLHFKLESQKNTFKTVTIFGDQAGD